jgi:hypothetical protein
MKLEIKMPNGTTNFDTQSYIVAEVTQEQYCNGMFLAFRNSSDRVIVEMSNDEAMALINQLSNGIRENLRHL